MPWKGNVALSEETLQAIVNPRPGTPLSALVSLLSFPFLLLASCTYTSLADSTAEMENDFTARSTTNPSSVSSFLPPIFSSSLPSLFLSSLLFSSLLFLLFDSLHKLSRSTPLIEQALTLMMSACESARKHLSPLVISSSLALVDWLGPLFPNGAARYPIL